MQTRKKPRFSVWRSVLASLVMLFIFNYIYSELFKDGRIMRSAFEQGTIHLCPGSLVPTAVNQTDHNETAGIDRVTLREVLEEKETTIGTLGTVLERIAVNNTVIICTVNEGYWDLFLNFLVSLHKLGLADRLLVFAGDTSTWRFLESHWPGHTVIFRYPGGTSKDRITTTLKAQGIGGAGFRDIVRRRPSQILACLEHGYSVLYSDIDCVFVKDPFPYMLGDFDGCFGWDGMIQDPWINGSDHLPTLEESSWLNFCSCFLFFRPSQQSLEVMQQWYTIMRVTRSTLDQPKLNDVLNAIRLGNDTSFSFSILPQKHFQSGGILRDQESKWRSIGGDPVVMHVNYFFGTEKKITTLRKYNLWFLEDDAVNGTVEWPSSLLKTISS